MQTLGKALKPVTHRVTHTDRGQRVAGGGDADTLKEREIRLCKPGAFSSNKLLSLGQGPLPGSHFVQMEAATLDPERIRETLSLFSPGLWLSGVQATSPEVRQGGDFRMTRPIHKQLCWSILEPVTAVVCVQHTHTSRKRRG